MIELVDPNSGLKLTVANRPRELARGTIDTLFEVLDGKRAMAEDSEVRIPAVVITPDDPAAVEAFLAEQYFSSVDLNRDGVIGK